MAQEGQNEGSKEKRDPAWKVAGRLLPGGWGRQVDANGESGQFEAEPLNSQLRTREDVNVLGLARGDRGLGDLTSGRGFSPRGTGDSSELQLLLGLRGYTGSGVTVVAPHQDSLCTRG